MCNSTAKLSLDARENGAKVAPASAPDIRSRVLDTRSCASLAVVSRAPLAPWQIWTLALLALCVPSSANAEAQLYSAEMILHTRGSDVGGNFIGIPFGAHCNMNPYHAEHSLMFSYTSPPRTYTLTIPKFGGQVPVIDTNMDSVPDVPAGCGTASRMAGLPLTGSGVVSTTGATSTTRTTGSPRGFTLPKSGFSRVTSGASLFPTTWIPIPGGVFPFRFEIEYADLRNDSGSFAKGGGPGSFSVSSGARVHVTAGKNQFGGTMRLLGSYWTNRGDEAGSTSVGATPWNLQYIGAGAQTSMGVVTAGLNYQAMIMRPYHYPGKFAYSARTATASVFPWTTGVVEVTAASGPQATILQRSGYDNRSPNGAGTVQLVSPMVTRWKNSLGDYHTGGIAIMKLRFVPEPRAWLMLVAGASSLGLLHRLNRRFGRA